MEVKELPLDAVRIDGGTQSREELDLGAIADYGQAMQDGDRFPACKAVFDGKDHWLYGGFHRYHASKAADRETLWCEVEKGTLDDARWLALAENVEHDLVGVRRTNKDKRRAVEAALRLRPDMSDRVIADHCGTHHQMVATLRRSLDDSSSQPATRTGRDGRTIDTNNIGKTPRQSSLPMFGAEVRPYEVRPPAADALGEYVTLARWKGMTAAERKKTLQPTGAMRKVFNDQGDNENIEWALWSWNPVTGCEHNCPYCYARDIANRFYPSKFEATLWPDRLLAPRNTTFPEAKAAAWMGHKNVFTCSMADLFGRWVPREWIDAVLAAVRAAPRWNFLFLTKFPVRMAEFDFPDNAWVGTSVDCQARVANAERSFRKVKAKVKWLSCEPMIEPLKFADLGAFDWVVIGGASRSSETPEWHPPRAWVNAIEADAERCGVMFYEKSNLLERIRQYPGVDSVLPTEAPEQLRYLAKVER